MAKILAIDDNEDNLVVLKALLKEAFPEAEFIGALSGKKGIAICLTQKPDVVLLDIIMPEMDGYEVCRFLKTDEATKTIPVIMITAARTDKESRIRALEFGADAFLAKPVDESELAAQITAMLRIKEAEDRKLDENERLKRQVEERTNELQKELQERKLAEKAIEESEVRFRHISSSISDISYSCVKDAYGNSTIDWLYGATEKITGYTADELLAMKCWGKLVIDEDFPTFDKHILNALPRKSQVCQLRLKKKDGSIIWVQASAENMQEQTGTNFSIIYGSLVDINERKRAEEELIKTFSLIEATLESIHNGILVVDSEGVVIKASKRFAEMWKIPENILASGDDNILLNHILEQLADPDGFIAQVTEAYHKPEAETFDLIHFKDGRIFERISKPVYLGGSPKARVWSFLDITERKLAEEALKESETQFREFFEKAADAIFIAEIESGLIVDANEAASRLLQMPREQIVGLHQSQIHPKQKEEISVQNFREHDKMAGQSLPTAPSEIEIVRPDGSLVPVEVMASRVIYQNKNCLMGTFRDITERKQADIKLRESEYLFKESQKAAFVGSYKFDLRNNTWTSSQVLDQIFGIDKNYDHSLQGWHEIIHPDDREMMAQYFNEEVIAKRMLFNKEYRIISQFEGVIRWVLGLGKLNFDAEGNIIEMIGTIQDITERKLSQVALQESEEKYSILFKDSPDAYLIITDGVFTDCNKATEIMMRGDRTQIIGKNPEALSPEFQPDGRKSSDSAIDNISKAFKYGKNTFEWIHRRFDGSDFYAEVTIAATMIQGKSTLFTTWREITERKQAEKKLKESQQLFQELFNASPDAIVLIDPHHPTTSWPIVDCNEAACRMNGFTRDEMIGKSIDLLNLTVGTPEERVAYLNSLRQKDVFQTESIHHHKDGHEFPVEISTSIITIEGREMVLGIDRDITERKQEEEAVHLSEVRLKRAELASKSGNWEFYLNSKTLNPSEGASKVFGVNGQQFSYDGIKEISLPEYRPILDVALRNLIKNDISYEIEFKIRKVDTGEIKDIQSAAFFDREKRIIFGVVQDITERKQAEVELKKSEDRYRRFISQVSEGVYRFESDEPMDISLPVEGQIDFIYDHMFIAECNTALRQMYGMGDESEMIGKSHLDFHGGRNNSSNRNVLSQFINNGYRIENATTEEINHKGQVVFFSNNSLGIIENNQLVRIWGTQTDITEKTKSDQVQQVLYTISNAAISSTDLSDLVEIISIQLSKLLDTSNFYIAFYDEASGMLSTLYSRDEVGHIDSWPAEKSATGYIIKSQKSLLASKTDMVNLCEKGEIEMVGAPAEIWLGVPLVLGKKAIGAIVVQSYDNPNAYNEKDQLMLEFISDQICISLGRKKAEQEIKDALAKAQESDRLKSAFLANMSHEIRTPLNAIIGFSELIRDPAFEPEQQDEFAQLINDSGNNLLSILSDIMDISKIEAGQMDITKRKVSVNKLITSMQKEFARKAAKKGVELRLKHANPFDVVEVETDETKIRQIMVNFLSNALKFTDQGFIELGIEPEESLVRLYVKDTGIGIPVAYHDKIFERFRQVETSHTRKYGGNGLGLCISKNLVELLGGTIGMESEVDKGSTFYITIPRK